MKVMFSSVSPWIPSGYGMQTSQVCRRLRDAGHDVAISGYAGIEGKIASWEGITVYPTDHTRFNKYALRKYVQRHSANGTGDDVLVISLQDQHIWLDASVRAGGTVADYRGLNIAAWCPVDHDPMPVNTVLSLEAFGARPIAMSRFGEDRMRQAGLEPLYCPHAVDTSVLRPNPEARAKVRQSLNVPDDAFMVGMVAHNQGMSPCRKSFPEVFQAFSMFLEGHPDSILYLHTDVLGLDGGLNLTALWNRFAIPDESIRFVNQDKFWFGELATEHMALTYAALDVLAAPSYGEGFGIPLIESQACGVPVITTDWTSMTELVGPGWLVDGDPWYNPGSASFWKRPSIDELIRALEFAYKSRGDASLSEECRRFALRYDADTVFEEYWVPALEALAGPREVPPLPNAVRRAPSKVAA